MQRVIVAEHSSIFVIRMEPAHKVMFMKTMEIQLQRQTRPPLPFLLFHLSLKLQLKRCLKGLNAQVWKIVHCNVLIWIHVKDLHLQSTTNKLGKNDLLH